MSGNISSNSHFNDQTNNIDKYAFVTKAENPNFLQRVRDNTKPFLLRAGNFIKNRKIITNKTLVNHIIKKVDKAATKDKPISMDTADNLFGSMIKKFKDGETKNQLIYEYEVAKNKYLENQLNNPLYDSNAPSQNLLYNPKTSQQEPETQSEEQPLEEQPEAQAEAQQEEETLEEQPPQTQVEAQHEEALEEQPTQNLAAKQPIVDAQAAKDAKAPTDKPQTFQEVLPLVKEDLAAYLAKGNAENANYIAAVLDTLGKIESTRDKWDAFFEEDKKQPKNAFEVINKVSEELNVPTHATSCAEIKTVLEEFPPMLAQAYLLAKANDRLDVFFKDAFKNTPCIEAKYRILNSWLEREVLNNDEAVNLQMNLSKESNQQVFTNAMNVFLEVQARDFFNEKYLPMYNQMLLGRLAGMGEAVPSFVSEEWQEMKTSIYNDKNFQPLITDEKFLEFLAGKLPPGAVDKDGVPMTRENLGTLYHQYKVDMGLVDE